MQNGCWDIAVIGGGAAGIATAIFAAEEAQRLGTKTNIVILDGARKLGAKILVSGGGTLQCHPHFHDRSRLQRLPQYCSTSFKII